MVKKRVKKDLSNRIVLMVIMVVILVSIASLGIYYKELNDYNSSLDSNADIFRSSNNVNGKVSIQIEKPIGNTASDELNYVDDKRGIVS